MHPGLSAEMMFDKNWQKKKETSKADLFFVSLVHFRYHFSDTKKDRYASKFSNISFASFDIFIF